MEAGAEMPLENLNDQKDNSVSPDHIQNVTKICDNSDSSQTSENNEKENEVIKMIINKVKLLSTRIKCGNVNLDFMNQLKY